MSQPGRQIAPRRGLESLTQNATQGDMAILRSGAWTAEAVSLRDVALGRAYTLSDSPGGAYVEENWAKNGASHKYTLTSPGGLYSPALGFANGYLGWRATDIAGTSLTIKIDYGASNSANISWAAIEGHWNTGQQIYHPASAKLEYSDNDSSYTGFGTAYTSLSDNPGTLGTSQWWFEFEDSASARYWRWTVGEPSPGAGDNWIFISRVRLLGTK